MPKGDNAESAVGTESVGRVAATMGPICDVELDRAGAVFLLDTLRARGVGADVRLTVVQRRSATRLRCVVLGLPDGLCPGMTVVLTDEVAEAIPDATLNAVVVGAGQGTTYAQWIPTGIKVVDMMAPLPMGGCVGILGDPRAGRTTFVAEIRRRLSATPGGKLTLCVLAAPSEVPGTQRTTNAAPDLASGDVCGEIETLWLVSHRARDARQAEIGPFDATLYFSGAKAITGLHPAIDPVRSGSRLLREDVVGRLHLRTAHRVRLALRNAACGPAGPLSLYLTPPPGLSST